MLSSPNPPRDGKYFQPIAVRGKHRRDAWMEPAGSVGGRAEEQEEGFPSWSEEHPAMYSFQKGICVLEKGTGSRMKEAIRKYKGEGQELPLLWSKPQFCSGLRSPWFMCSQRGFPSVFSCCFGSSVCHFTCFEAFSLSLALLLLLI